MDIRQTNLSTRTSNCLWRNRIQTTEQLIENVTQYGPRSLLLFRNFGTASLAEVQTFLAGRPANAEEDTDQTVLALRHAHRATWRNQPESYWLARLMEEMGELAASLVGDHADSPDHELKQIASIALNWLEYRQNLSSAQAP